MKNYSEISTRYMKQNKKRTLLTVVGITLATVLIFAVGTFLLSFRDSMIQHERSKGDFEFRLRDISGTQADKVINNVEVKDSAISNKSEAYVIEGNSTDVLKHIEQNEDINTDGVLAIKYGNKDYYKKIFNSELLEGKLPNKEDEVIIDSSSKKLLNLKVGDYIDLVNAKGETKRVNLVGSYYSTIYSTGGIKELTGYFESNNLIENKNYTVTVNLKSKKNKQEIIKKIINENNIDIDNKEDNGQLLYLTGNGGNDFVTKSLNNMAIFVVAIIMLCTIVVIYNSFNISVIERIRYFGILKAIGATPKQIKRIVFKEAALMGLMAFPMGCIIGFLALKYGIKIFIGDTLMLIENFSVNFYPSIILLTIVLVAITIALSVIGPARKANKVSAVDAIRNKNEIKMGKLKRRKARLVGKVFGVEGSIAYKNIRRTPIRFIVTVLALTMSVAMFNVFYGFVDFVKQSMVQQFMYSPYDSVLDKEIYRDSFTDAEIKEVSDLGFLKEQFKYNVDNLNIMIPEKDLNKDYDEKTGSNLDVSGLYKDLGYAHLSGTDGYIAGDNSLKVVERYITEGSYDVNKLKNNGVIIIDGTTIRNANGDLESIRATNYKVGDKLKLPKLKNYSSRVDGDSTNDVRESIKNNDFYELEVVGIANKNPIFGQPIHNGIEIMIHEDTYKKMVGDFKYNTIFFSFNGDEESRQKAIEYFDKAKVDKNYKYMDIGDQLKEIDQIYGQIEFFVYCFIAIVTIIAVVNIFNIISTNILIRRKEFSTLKAIGMTENQLKKSVMLEGTLYGILAAIVGGGISAVLLGVLIKLGAGFAEVKYDFDMVAFSISIISAILITYIATLIPLRKLTKLSIVEGISEDE